MTRSRIRRKLYRATTDHEARYERYERPWGSGWKVAGCKCGWNGIALHEHQMDELVKAAEEATETERLVAARLRMLVEDFPDNAVPTVSVSALGRLLEGGTDGDDV